MAGKAPTRASAAAAPQAVQEPVNTPAPAQVPAPVSNASGAVALPSDLEAELAGYAQEAAAKERPSVAKLSLKNGMLSIHQQPLKERFIDAILLACAYRNTFYAGRYDPNNIVNPTCFAIQPSNEDMRPHENVAEPINDTCEGCPNNEWGSAGEGSRGKACKEGRRLLMVPADAMSSAEAFNKAEFCVMDVPVTSVKNYGNFVNVLAASVKRPMWAVVTRIEVVPDAKTQFKVTFTPMEMINDPEVIRAIKAREADAIRIACIPYDEAYLAGEKDEKGQPTKEATKRKF